MSETRTYITCPACKGIHVLGECAEYLRAMIAAGKLRSFEEVFAEDAPAPPANDAGTYPSLARQWYELAKQRDPDHFEAPHIEGTDFDEAQKYTFEQFSTCLLVTTGLEILADREQSAWAQAIETVAEKHSLYPGAIAIMCSCGQAFNHVAFVAAEEWKRHIRSLQPSPTWLREHDKEVRIRALNELANSADVQEAVIKNLGLLSPAQVEQREQRVIAKARRDAFQEAKVIAASTPFRAHSKDDVDFHSGCEQTRERIVRAIAEREAAL
jgi:hypothetical protein